MHLMPYRNPCSLYIHLAFTYSSGPLSVVWSELGPALPFPPMRVLEVQWSRALSLGWEVVLNITHAYMSIHWIHEYSNYSLWATQQKYSKYCIWCHLLIEITQYHNYLPYISIYIHIYMCVCVFCCQQMSNWLFGHYRKWTSLLGNKLLQ